MINKKMKKIKPEGWEDKDGIKYYSEGYVETNKIITRDEERRKIEGEILKIFEDYTEKYNAEKEVFDKTNGVLAQQSMLDWKIAIIVLKTHFPFLEKEKQ